MVSDAGKNNSGYPHRLYLYKFIHKRPRFRGSLPNYSLKSLLIRDVHGNVQILQLCEIHIARAPGPSDSPRCVLGERDEVTDGFAAFESRDHAVETECETSVRGAPYNASTKNPNLSFTCCSVRPSRRNLFLPEHWDREYGWNRRRFRRR